MKTVEEQLQELRNRVETLESRLEVVKEVLMDSKAKSFKFYSEEESKALVEALKDIPVGPDIMKTCLRLIDLGWNDRFDQLDEREGFFRI